MNPNETQALETVLGDFRKAVLTKMEERGMSKAELSRLLGLSRSRVSAIFQADNVTLKTVVRVCVALGIEMVGTKPLSPPKKPGSCIPPGKARVVDQGSAVPEHARFAAYDAWGILRATQRTQEAAWEMLRRSEGKGCPHCSDAVETKRSEGGAE